MCPAYGGGTHGYTQVAPFVPVYCDRSQGSALGVSHNSFLAGPVSLSTPAQLIAPSFVMKGILSVTSFEVYFEVDEDDPNFKKIDPKVRES